MPREHFLGAAVGFAAGALGFGGGKSKSTTRSETTVLNENIFNFLNKDENTVSSQVMNVQDMSVSGVTAYCDLDISQNINADIRIMQEFNAENTADLVSEIGGAVEQQIKRTTEEKSGFLSIPKNKEKTDETITNITNSIEKNITFETINKLSSTVINDQTLHTSNVVIDPVGMGVYLEMGIPPPVELAQISANTECAIDQNIQIKYVAEQLANKVTKIINEDSSAMDLANKLEVFEKSEEEGIGGMFESIGKGFNNIFTGGGFDTSIMSIASSCSSCILVLVAGGAFMMSPQGKAMMGG